MWLIVAETVGVGMVSPRIQAPRCERNYRYTWYSVYSVTTACEEDPPMTDGDSKNSGELSTFLHLTGWRPLILALIAGLAGAYGLFSALNAPAEWQARYVLNASRVADDDLLPQELDIFVEEIAQTAKFGTVEAAVEERTGLVNEEDYEIVVNQSGASLQLIDINVVSEVPENAQRVAIETGIEALTITLEKILGGHEAARDRIQAEVDILDAQIADLTQQAGGINPTFAYDRASQDLLDREAFLRNPPQFTETTDDGLTITRDADEPEPPLEELQARVNELEPIDREYRQVQVELDALSAQLSTRTGDVRDALSAIALVEVERESPRIISEVITEETSRIAGLLTGLLLFAIPAALITILGFVLLDLVRPKPDPVPTYDRPAFDAAGVLEASGQRALPETTIMRPLTVVDEEEPTNNQAAPSTDILDVDGTAIHESPDHDDDPTPPTKKGSKPGRWGRDAGSKAG